MAVDAPGGKRAVTRWTVLERRGPLALVEFAIETGRTHQIRVHAAHLGHPIVGDALYGDAAKDRRLASPPRRQLLHAVQLEFRHPSTGRAMRFAAPPPNDIIYAR
jgi:23S rRNA pseudouridine1911/1915/1917 synthase